MTLVMMEFLFPTFTEVLSTAMPMQLSHVISFDESTSSILENIVAAVPHSAPNKQEYKVHNYG